MREDIYFCITAEHCVDIMQCSITMECLIGWIFRKFIGFTYNELNAKSAVRNPRSIRDTHILFQHTFHLVEIVDLTTNDLSKSKRCRYVTLTQY